MKIIVQFCLAGFFLISICLKPVIAAAQTKSPQVLTTVSGSVFVVLKSGSNIKLALAPVHVMSETQFLEICQNVKPKIDQTTKDLAFEYFDTADNNPTKRLAILKVLETVAENIYFDAFPAPTVKSDADGKFTLTFHDHEPKVIACRSQREIVGAGNLDDQESYFWAVKFQPAGKPEQLMFSNDNLKNILPAGDISFHEEVKRLEGERSARFQEERAKAADKAAELKRIHESEYRKAQEAKKQEITRRAVNFNRTQAEKGDAYGQFRMGERYRDGDGVEKDATKARDYFSKAAAQGHTEAAKALEKMKTLPMP